MNISIYKVNITSNGFGTFPFRTECTELPIDGVSSSIVRMRCLENNNAVFVVFN